MLEVLRVLFGTAKNRIRVGIRPFRHWKILKSLKPSELKSGKTSGRLACVTFIGSDSLIVSPQKVSVTYDS